MDDLEQQQQLQAELKQGENVLWKAQPSPGRMCIRSLGMFFFGIFWTAFSIFWVAGASGWKLPDFGDGGSALFPLFGVPFVVIGLGMLASPLWAYWKALGTLYGVTDRRILIICSRPRRSVNSYTAKSLDNIERTDRANWTGDIIFARQIARNSEGGETTTKIGFFGIPNVRHVEGLLLQTFKR